MEMKFRHTILAQDRKKRADRNNFEVYKGLGNNYSLDRILCGKRLLSSLMRKFIKNYVVFQEFNIDFNPYYEYNK